MTGPYAGARAGQRTIVPLQDAMEAIIDYRGKTPTKTLSGVPLITAKVVKGGRIEEPDEFIAESAYVPWMRRGIPKPGDVLITTEAPLGEVAQLDGRKVALAQRLIALRGKPELLDNRYLFYLLQSSTVQSDIQSRATGTTVLGIKQSELRKVLLPLPPLPKQKRIAGILGSLDDKIELNRRMNRTLEELARAVFRAWFVDFLPVKAKQDGAKCFPGMDADTFALFPDSFEDSPLGPIPEGWNVGTVGQICTQSKASVTPSSFPEELFDHFSIPAYDEGMMPQVETGTTILSNKFDVQPGCVLLSKLNPRFPRIWLPDLPAERRSICSTEFLVLRPNAPALRPFLYSLLWSDAIRDQMEMRVTGTSTSHQRLTPDTLMALEFAMPQSDLIKPFDRHIGSLLALSCANRTESVTLANARATLLPRLMGGAD